MKRLLIVLVLAAIGYGGYLYYTQSAQRTLAPTYIEDESGTLVISHTGNKIDNLASVLGASISNIMSTGQEYLSSVTSGASEPIINQLISKTQETLKDLPKREAEKIKYEFCKDVVTEFENKSEIGETP